MSWESIELGQLSKKIDYGLTASALQGTEGYKFLRITDIQNDHVEWENVPVCKCEDKKLSKYRLATGDIVFARTGATTGKSYLIKECPEDSLFASYLIRVRHKKELDPRFLSYFFKTPQYWSAIAESSTGATLPGVNSTKLKKLIIPLPPLDIQKKIATVLDKADQLRQKRKKAIEKLDQLIQSVFLDMFGDSRINPYNLPIINLGEIATVIMGQSPKGDSYNSDGVGSPLLNGPTEFGDKYPKEKQWTTEPKKYSGKGDILFCVRGATAGRMNWSNKTYCIGRGIAAIRSKDRESNEYIYIILKSMYKYFQDTSDGSTFINISRDKLLNLKIPLPESELQKKFIKISKKIDSQKTELKKSSVIMDNLFNSLLQQAFKGELKFNDKAFKELEEVMN